MGTIISQYKDPYKPISRMECQPGVWFTLLTCLCVVPSLRSSPLRFPTKVRKKRKRGPPGNGPGDELDRGQVQGRVSSVHRILQNIFYIYIYIYTFTIIYICTVYPMCLM